MLFTQETFFKNVLFLLIFVVLLRSTITEIASGRIRGDDEPRIVSWRVLEGVTEPFESNLESNIPLWKQQKNAADHQAANRMIQQALHEYGQLIRHPYLFGEMPMEERYDVFISMSKLLKLMGFHQRAELLLYEAMSYTTYPYEAHLQLGLLYLDKEDLANAKLHLKNCLFFQESDVLILIHLSVILLAEGKTQEAKFFLSRIIHELETKVNKFSFVLTDSDIKDITKDKDYKVLSAWLEDLFVKVLYGEFRVPPSATMDMLGMFSNLYKWVTALEMTGRFVFDIGQSLYEGGRPKIGQMMMQRGFETSNQDMEGVVSTQIVAMRLAFDYPVVPELLLDIIQSYWNMTKFLSETSQSYTIMDLENVLDIYWPLPLVWWSALPMAPVMKELYWRFSGGPIRSDDHCQTWLMKKSLDDILDHSLPANALYTAWFEEGSKSEKAVSSDKTVVGKFDEMKEKLEVSHQNKRNVIVPPTSHSKGVDPLKVKVEIGLIAGHMNSHPIGQFTWRRVLSLLQSPIHHRTHASNATSSLPDKRWKDRFRITLIAFPLVPDATTKLIASSVDRIVNLPVDNTQAWKIIESLDLDIALFPDWQPFPDQQSAFFITRRIAPIQACFFVRGGIGSSCASDTMDFYLLPSEFETAYLNLVPAADVHSRSNASNPFSNRASRRPSADNNNSKPSSNEEKSSTKSERFIRPAWKESYSEQVVLLDWPVITTQMIKDTIQFTSKAVKSQTPSDEQYDGMSFSPLEIEGKVFFEGQPVAVLPYHPTFFHPLMDDVLFTLLRSVTSLHLVIALPDTFLMHVKDSKHKVSWARKLVRRLWLKGGNLYHRIRLLPTPMSDQRILSLLRQADMVLDTFPIGAPSTLIALALGVGTPVITLQTGTVMQTSRDNLKEIRSFLIHSSQKSRNQKSENNSEIQQARFSAVSHPMGPLIMFGDVPWNPSTNNVQQLYERMDDGGTGPDSFQSMCVAGNVSEYYRIAANLALNREVAYSLRVKILDALDRSTSTPRSSSSLQDEPSHSTKDSNDDASMEPPLDGAQNHSEDHRTGVINKQSDCIGSCVDDLGSFLWRVGMPFAYHRVMTHHNATQQMHRVPPSDSHLDDNESKGSPQRKRRRRVAAATNRWEEEDWSNQGTIFQ